MTTWPHETEKFNTEETRYEPAPAATVPLQSRPSAVAKTAEAIAPETLLRPCFDRQVASEKCRSCIILHPFRILSYFIMVSFGFHPNCFPFPFDLSPPWALALSSRRFSKSCRRSCKRLEALHHAVHRSHPVSAIHGNL